MKYLFILALFVVATPVLAAVNYAPTDGTIGCNGQSFLAGDELPSCGQGGVAPTTTWVVYKARTFTNGVSSEAAKAVKFVNSEKEYYRLSMLELARQILSAPTRHNWKGTMIEGWLDRYAGGER